MVSSEALPEFRLSFIFSFSIKILCRVALGTPSSSAIFLSDFLDCSAKSRISSFLLSESESPHLFFDDIVNLDLDRVMAAKEGEHRG